MNATSNSPTQPATADARELSVVVPIFNEADNIAELCRSLTDVLAGCGKDYEVILVNDGSRDQSLEVMAAAVRDYERVIAIDLRRNYGQTAALMAGIDYARGQIIILIDADLQNDPRDVPLLIDKLAEGYDVVSGWRKDRQDAPLQRNLVSRIANRLISWISGVKLHDYGCTLKAYRRDVIKDVRLYGEMHRFIPIYASWMGARVCEIPVQHYPRKFGQSKYGLERVFKVLLDLIVVKFLDRHFVKPIYVFGGFGMLALAASALCVALMVYWKVVDGTAMIQTPMPVLSAMGFMVGIMSILMGLLAEMLVRVYFESQQRSSYVIRRIIDADTSS